MDGTQDTSGNEQLSICLRYVDEQLNSLEMFMGLYEPQSTTGDVFAKCALDVLLKLQLPLTMLRGQTYDGASNMSGQYSGCQAIIAQEQPLALYVHSGAHSANLVAQAVTETVEVVRDAVYLVYEI